MNDFFFVGVCAWCGGMSLAFALVKWRDELPWRTDAVNAVFGLLMAVLGAV
jgi:hypothetical protein